MPLELSESDATIKSITQESSITILDVPFTLIYDVYVTGFLWCVVRHIIKGTKVTAQFSKNLEPPKIIYNCIDWHFICFIYSKYSGVFSNGYFSTHAILDSLTGSVSHSHNPLFSLSLSPSLPLSPHPVFTCFLHLI